MSWATGLAPGCCVLSANTGWLINAPTAVALVRIPKPWIRARRSILPFMSVVFMLNGLHPLRLHRRNSCRAFQELNEGSYSFRSPRAGGNTERNAGVVLQLIWERTHELRSRLADDFADLRHP